MTLKIKELRKKMKNEGNQILDEIEKMALEEGIKIAKKIVKAHLMKKLSKYRKRTSNCNGRKRHICNR